MLIDGLYWIGLYHRALHCLARSILVGRPRHKLEKHLVGILQIKSMSSEYFVHGKFNHCFHKEAKFCLAVVCIT